MTAKAKNSKKQQQAITTAMVTPNPFVVPDKILSKISTAAASSLPDIDSNSDSSTLNITQDQLLAVLLNVVISGRFFSAIKAKQFSGWVASTLVPSAIFKIKMALFNSLFQLLSGCIGLISVSQDVVKLFCVEFASQKSLNSATKVVIDNKVFLTTFKIAQSSGVVYVFSLLLLVALHDVPLSTSSDDIKSVLGIFGVVTFVKLKSAGLWQYAVVYFKDAFSTATALIHWSVLVKKDSVRIFFVVNQNNVILSRDAFKAKCQELDHLAVDCKVLPLLLPKFSFNSAGGPKVFKSSFAKTKSYAKAAAYVVPPIAAAVNMDLDFGAPLQRLASLESHFGKLSLLIKFLVEPVGVLVILVTRLLFASSAMDVFVKESMVKLARQNKDFAVIISMMQKKMVHLEKKYEQAWKMY
ncbi:hypothetical protein G9A89_009467 [Geosiphon pyriformis]|nr:hypothetical protein G9A89_009467 [Geosiphon pyriformis]